jgi:hypothetical protein
MKIYNEEIRINGKNFDLSIEQDFRLSAWRWKLSGGVIKRDGIASKENLAIQAGRNAMFKLAM